MEVRFGDDRLPVRFWANVSPEPMSGCWLWMGRCDRSGYGRFAVGHSKKHLAHRLIQRLTVGEVPDGYHVDHLCRVRCCVNPTHLEPVTPSENARRANVLRRFEPKKICKNGHSMAGDTRTFLKGRYVVRRCRVCERAQCKKFYEKKKKKKQLAQAAAPESLPRRRRRTTSVTQPMAPVTMADIAEAFRKAMEESR